MNKAILILTTFLLVTGSSFASDSCGIARQQHHERISMLNELLKNGEISAHKYATRLKDSEEILGSCASNACDSLVVKSIPGMIEDLRLLEDLPGYCEDEQECLPDTQIYYLRTADQNRIMKRFIMITESLNGHCTIVNTHNLTDSK